MLVNEDGSGPGSRGKRFRRIHQGEALRFIGSEALQPQQTGDNEALQSGTHLNWPAGKRERFTIRSLLVVVAVGQRRPWQIFFEMQRITLKKGGERFRPQPSFQRSASALASHSGGSASDRLLRKPQHQFGRSEGSASRWAGGLKHFARKDRFSRRRRGEPLAPPRTGPVVAPVS